MYYAKQKVKPLNEEQITKLIKALKGNKYEKLILTTLFTGLFDLDGFEFHPKIKTRYPNGYLVFMAEDEGFDCRFAFGKSYGAFAVQPTNGNTSPGCCI